MISFIAAEGVRKRVPNIYEAVIVAACEGRRLNIRAKMLGTDDERAEKMTTLALQRLLDGKVHFAYKTDKEQSHR